MPHFVPTIEPQTDISKADNTQPIAWRHKAHFYNMLSYRGQTVLRRVAKSANRARDAPA